jgi:hypothetical protein
MTREVANDGGEIIRRFVLNKEESDDARHAGGDRREGLRWP